MTIKIYLSVLFTWVTVWFAVAQTPNDSLRLAFNIKWNDQEVALQKKYVSEHDSLEITTFKFYVSSIRIQFDDNSTYIQKNSFHLIDIEKRSSLIIPVCIAANKNVQKVTFCIGVDSLASVSGALAGDLDATNGMYWAWQSGFINVKIEGKSNSCKTRKNQFQFHIGGYLKPNFALRKIQLDSKIIKNIDNTLKITCNAANFFNKIDLATNNAVMIPGEKAMKMADLVSKIFYLE